MNKTVTGRKLLIVEDNSGLRESYAAYFRERYNAVTEAGTLAEAKNYLYSDLFDAVLLDILLPDGEGLELFDTHVKLPPVLIITTLDGDSDILEGFSAGACDYVVKPCSPEVLEARLVLRLLPKPEAVISIDGLKIDLTERTCTYKGAEISLTGSEFNILYFFMTHPSVFFTSAEIYENVWHAPSLKTTTIKYHISNLRQKLLNATGKSPILTEFGRGYSFYKKDCK